MKYDYNVFGMDFDDFSEAAKEFGRKMKDWGKEAGNYCRDRYDLFEKEFNEAGGFRPVYAYPPLNEMILPDRSMVLEFALPGFDEKGVSLSFQGDYLVLSAHTEDVGRSEEDLRVLHRRFTARNIDRQKYFVPKGEYAQEASKAVFKNSVLSVTIPPKEDAEAAAGVKIEVVRDED